MEYDFDKLWADSIAQEDALGLIALILSSEFIWICNQSDFLKVSEQMQKKWDEFAANARVYTFASLTPDKMRAGNLECKTFAWQGKTIHLLNRVAGQTVAICQVRYACT